MADIVNLRRARKAKDKADRAAAADANRIKFGRSKAERELEAARNRQTGATLDAHKIEDDAGKDPSCT
jgi:hypothetical protein